MSTRTFPGIKPQKYDPEAMAKALAKAKAEGKTGSKAEEEEDYDYHKVVHRHQTRTFEIHQDGDKAADAEFDEKKDEEE